MVVEAVVVVEQLLNDHLVRPAGVVVGRLRVQPLVVVDLRLLVEAAAHRPLPGRVPAFRVAEGPFPDGVVATMRVVLLRTVILWHRWPPCSRSPRRPHRARRGP